MSYRHADLVRIVIQAIRDANPELQDDEIAPDHSLVSDLNLSSTRIIWVFERLERELGLQLWPSIIVEYVIAGPSVGRLARTMAAQLHEQGGTEGARHAA
ncbi:MAG: hypothetical protein WCP77_16160 [Roseococcus sp.]